MEMLERSFGICAYNVWESCRSSLHTKCKAFYSTAVVACLYDVNFIKEHSTGKYILSVMFYGFFNPRKFLTDKLILNYCTLPYKLTLCTCMYCRYMYLTGHFRGTNGVSTLYFHLNCCVRVKSVRAKLHGVVLYCQRV